MLLSSLREKLPTLYGDQASTSTVEEGLRRADRVAWWLEESVEVPILRLRVGLDTLLGMLPGIGDLTSGMLSLYPIVEGIHLGAPRRLIGRMLANVAADLFVGSVPVVGDLFDLWFKANRRNVALLQRHFGVA